MLNELIAAWKARQPPSAFEKMFQRLDQYPNPLE